MTRPNSRLSRSRPPKAQQEEGTPHSKLCDSDKDAVKPARQLPLPPNSAVTPVKDEPEELFTTPPSNPAVNPIKTEPEELSTGPPPPGSRKLELPEGNVGEEDVHRDGACNGNLQGNDDEDFELPLWNEPNSNRCGPSATRDGEQTYRFSEVLRAGSQDKVRKRRCSNIKLMRRIFGDSPRADDDTEGEIIRIVFRRRSRTGTSRAAINSQAFDGWTPIAHLVSRIPSHDPATVVAAIESMTARGCLENTTRLTRNVESGNSLILRVACSLIRFLHLRNLKVLYRYIPGYKTGKVAPTRKSHLITAICNHLRGVPINPESSFVQRSIDPSEPCGLRIADAILKNVADCVRFSRNIRRELQNPKPHRS